MGYGDRGRVGFGGLFFMSHTCRLSREHAVLPTELLRT